MKMLKDIKSLPVIVLLLMIILVTAVFQNVERRPKSEERKKVSLIVYGDDSERWENLREGSELVCKENNADLVLVNMLSENDRKEQEENINREVVSGADALIIAACSSSGIKEYVDGLKLKIPVIFAETVESVQGKGSNITVDDYKMGYDLGMRLIENESDIVTVALISENTDRDSVALREQGLRDAIDGKVGKVINWSRNDNEKKVSNRVFIQRALVSQATDVIVTFDNSTTDALLDALENLNHKSKVYAISTSNKAVYNLYDRKIIALGYSDEFSLGYLSAMYALDSSGAKKKYPDREAKYRIVKREEMYDEDNQTLLFPFVN
ncbi:MAG: substrate-binding domain-containing protein [Lachnospiraceae bacterium]|nr:substrate-binding domain-containing protein [Lachnospiraceae bacterium]